MTVSNAGAPDNVDWHAVDKAVVIESLGDFRQPPESVAETLCKHIPETVLLAGKSFALDAIKQFLLEQSPRPDVGHAGERCEP